MKKSPAYMNLYMSLRDAITGGVYPFGSRLPAKRTLADDTGMSVVTVMHAYALLEEEGYIEAKERSGYYVIYQKDHFFASAGDPSYPREHISAPVSTGYSVPATSFPFPTFARTMRKVIAEYGERILTKSDPFGCGELRTALRDYLARSRGIVVSPEQIILGSGAEYLYSLVVQILGRDIVYALEDPSYEKIRKVYEANGAICEPLKMGPEGIESAALRSTRAGALHVTPFHSYPTGITASASKRREYIDWAKIRGAMLIEDDYDSEFSLRSKSEDTLFSLSPDDCVLYINTFSRTIAPSMRIGYMILPAKRAELFKNRIGFYSCTVPLFEQYVLAEFIQSGEFERHINRVRREIRRSK